ncbi:hypothetical protein BU14_0634s0002 [Porphyra umbilicalis]|uniref:Uncharacterized protein n=1 Tax=Porphyra umbilicalis TaxID=2786 RepID=A0A1X6NR04_PORUM|nr:hypothetical protein BU14_0634s0002 [Porphyra umbilicalis]|eukprot:OSX70916.1 hypothetical protein BU14_0634s0002 [Porphyra umbilicalis]
MEGGPRSLWPGACYVGHAPTATGGVRWWFATPSLPPPRRTYFRFFSRCPRR